MGIRFQCPNGHKLHVKAFLAGKRGICPECEARFIVPRESGVRVQSLSEPDSQPAPVVSSAAQQAASSEESVPLADPEDSNESGPAIWHVRHSTGEQFGPATEAEMRVWITEGRVAGDSWVWQPGWSDWQQASLVFPELTGPIASSAPSPSESGISEPTPIAVSEEKASSTERNSYSQIRAYQRSRHQRALRITFALSGLVFLLACALVFVLWKQG